MKANQAIKAFGGTLTEWEKQEIMGFKQVYFLGNDVEKIKGSSE